MSRRVEYLDALTGLRRDGRRALELRDSAFIIGGSLISGSVGLAFSGGAGGGGALQDQEQAAGNDGDQLQNEQQYQQQQTAAGGGAAASSSSAVAATSAAIAAASLSSSGTKSDGSAEIISPTSHVRALVFGPRQASMRDARPDGAHFTCEVTALRRRGGGAARRARSVELSSIVLESLQPVLMRSQYPLSTIHLHIDVLLSDGDEEVSCINAASLALADACIAMKDLVVASQVCFLDGQHVVADPTFDELRSGCPRWIEAVFAHRPACLAMLHEEGRYARKAEEEQAKDALHGACLQAGTTTAARLLEAVREHTNVRLAVLAGE